MKKQNFKREFSAGGVVYRKLKIKNEKLKIVFLLGKHSGYHKWVLPKGLIEKDEKSWQTAIRETEEEMGVKTRLVRKEAIHVGKYVYYADFKDMKKPPVASFQQPVKDNKLTRRVLKYQEAGGKKTKVFKAVTFYLLEYLSGDPKDHGWEMEEAGWFSYKEVLEKLDFKGEKEALKKAKEALGGKREQTRQKFLESVGIGSGPKDLSYNHDKYFRHY